MVRFKTPLEGAVTVDDRIKGRVVVSNSELDDLVIARPDGTPTYNFTVVVDDMDMNITEVIRGDDHLNNTPRQINIFQALDAPLPSFAHLPMILGDDGSRLSKRHGAVSVLEYRDTGYLPEALLNYLVRLGWSWGDQEVFSREEMINLFSIDAVNKSASQFNPDKLLWLNQQYLKSVGADRLADDLEPFYRRRGIDSKPPPAREAVADAYRERADTLDDMAERSAWVYRDFEAYDGKADKKFLRPVLADALAAAAEDLASVDDWQADVLHDTVTATAERLGMKFGKLGQPLRVAVCGGSNSPSIGITLALAGREKTLERIRRAIDHIAKKSPPGA